MFAKLSALVLALPLLVSALTIDALTGATPGGTVTIQWTASTTDPSYFSIELQNSIFNNQYAIANNVQTSLGEITITLPQVPVGGGYQLVAIATNNVNQVLSTSGTFSVTAGTTTTSSASSTTTSGASSSTSSGTASTESTPSATSTSPVSSGSSAVVTGTSSSTGTAASSTPSSFNSNGAAAFKMPGMVPAAGVLLAAVAGAAMVF